MGNDWQQQQHTHPDNDTVYTQSDWHTPVSHTHVSHTGIACAPDAPTLESRSLPHWGCLAAQRPVPRGQATGGGAWWRLWPAFWGRIPALEAENQPTILPVVAVGQPTMSFKCGAANRHTTTGVRQSAVSTHVCVCVFLCVRVVSAGVCVLVCVCVWLREL